MELCMGKPYSVCVLALPSKPYSVCEFANYLLNNNRIF